MSEGTVESFLHTHHQATFATIRKDGRPQLSSVVAAYRNGQLWISITEDRAKYKNLKRDPRCTVLVLGDTFWQYLTVSGTASMISIPAALPLLREYYVGAAGREHPDWQEYDQAMLAEKRVLAQISIDHTIANGI
ncbi:MAG: PPOX class F420-dependent oxidoreductase [Chloroflexota bacterium]